MDFINQINNNNKDKINYLNLVDSQSKLININSLITDIINITNSIKYDNSTIKYNILSEQLLSLKESYIQKDIQNINIDIKNKEIILKNIFLQQSNKIIKSLPELINSIENSYQVDNLNKILLNSEKDKIYFKDYNINTSKTTKNKNLIGTIGVLGTFNHSKNKRENYDIKIFNDLEDETFTCSCCDFKFNSKKKNTVCKHICFVICKIGKIYDTSFFITKKLNNEHLNILINKLSDVNIYNDKSIAKKVQTFNYNSFFNFTDYKENECSCIVCYTEVLQDEIDNNKCISCPKCNQIFHKECMDVWLEEHTKCAYCNTENIWNHFDELENDKDKKISFV